MSYFVKKQSVLPCLGSQALQQENKSAAPLDEVGIRFDTYSFTWT